MTPLPEKGRLCLASRAHKRAHKPWPLRRCAAMSGNPRGTSIGGGVDVVLGKTAPPCPVWGVARLDPGAQGYRMRADITDATGDRLFSSS